MRFAVLRRNAFFHVILPGRRGAAASHFAFSKGKMLSRQDVHADKGRLRASFFRAARSAGSVRRSVDPICGGKAAQRTQGCGYRKGKGVPQQASGMHMHSEIARRRDGHAGGHRARLGASVTRRPSSMVMKRLLTCWRKSQSWEMVMRAVGSAARMSNRRCRAAMSSALVGSSSRRACGCMASTPRQGDEFFLAAGKRMRLPVRQSRRVRAGQGSPAPVRGRRPG